MEFISINRKSRVRPPKCGTTTFKHSNSMQCQTWRINKYKNTNKDKLNPLLFKTEPVTSELKLSGPASSRKMSIMYTCQNYECIIMCPCAVCNKPPSAYNVQCDEHHVDIPRKYNKHVDSLIPPCDDHTFRPVEGPLEDLATTTACKNEHKYAGIPRSCVNCKTDLLDHQIHHHVVHGSCKFCQVSLRVFENESLRTWKEETKIKQVDGATCGTCYKIFTRIKTRKIHEKLEHGYYDDNPRDTRLYSLKQSTVDGWKLARVQCEDFEKSYASQGALRHHKLLVHTLNPTTLPCDQCDMTFTSGATLKRHTKSVHIQKSWIRCANCSAKFLREDNLNRHNKEVHRVANVNHHYNLNKNDSLDDVFPYPCDQCDKKFKRKGQAVRHTNKVHNNQKSKVQYCPAPTCRKPFRFLKMLDKHVRSVHLLGVEVKCDVCEVSFTRKADFIRHKLNVHGESPKEYKCEHCCKIFNRRDNMLRHVLKYCG